MYYGFDPITKEWQKLELFDLPKKDRKEEKEVDFETSG